MPDTRHCHAGRAQRGAMLCHDCSIGYGRLPGTPHGLDGTHRQRHGPVWAHGIPRLPDRFTSLVPTQETWHGWQAPTHPIPTYTGEKAVTSPHIFVGDW